MAAVMKEALKLDIEKEGQNQELIARLYTENKVNYSGVHTTQHIHFPEKLYLSLIHI